MTNAAFTKLVWQLREDGWLQCDYSYTVTGTQDVFGVMFDYPENLVKRSAGWAMAHSASGRTGCAV